MDPVVILGSESVSVGPGQEHRLPVRIRNQGRRVESFRVDIVGGPEAFAEVVPVVVSVLPGREAEIDVIFRPPGGASTPTGTLPFAVRATSEVDASSSAVAEGRLELAGVAGLQAWAPETSRSGRWSARYHVEFANQGNAAVRLALTANDPAGVTKLRLSPDVIDLPPGGRSTAQLKTTTRRPFLRGSKANRTLQVACQTFPFGDERPAPGAPPPQGDPNHRTFQLTFEQRPVLPKFAIPLLVLVLAVLIALAVLKLRQGESFALDLTAPLSPEGLAAEAAGESSIGLRWNDVPNAEGYEVRQVSAAGVDADQVLEAALPPDQLTLEVPNLEPATEYCFAVKALGPEERSSALTDRVCATTGVPTDLPSPTDVSATPQGGDRYQISWGFAAGSEGDVEFLILVDGAPMGTPVPLSGVTIEIPADVDERVAVVSVQALRGVEKSLVSEPFEITIPALPPETVPPTQPAPPSPPPPLTTLSPPTTLDTGTTVPPTTVGGGGSSTTIDPSTTPPLASELQNLAPTWAAMLGQATPASAGGQALEERKQRLSEIWGVPVADMLVFTNRDTFARRPDGSPSNLDLATADTRFIYVATDDQATAGEICAAGGTCIVLHLTGAARASEGSPILILAVLSSDASTADVDAQLNADRDELDRRDIHVLDGSDYPQLATNRPVVFVQRFASAPEVQGFCDAEGISPCDIKQLEPTG